MRIRLFQDATFFAIIRPYKRDSNRVPKKFAFFIQLGKYNTIFLPSSSFLLLSEMPWIYKDPGRFGFLFRCGLYWQKESVKIILFLSEPDKRYNNHVYGIDILSKWKMIMIRMKQAIQTPSLWSQENDFVYIL